MNPNSLENLSPVWTSETARDAARRRWQLERERAAEAEDQAVFEMACTEALGYLLDVIAGLAVRYQGANEVERAGLLAALERFADGRRV